MVEGSSMGLQMLQANYPEQLLVLGLGDASVVEKPATVEEKRLATWGTDVPEDLVLDQKLLVEALKKVIAEDMEAYGACPSTVGPLRSMVWFTNHDQHV
ncbi:pre-mRNA-splicing factor SLU7-A-like isoform X2 [Magnolia sinica]|uniref:pre-mRNA-splicing factor SLU7-A-like isoform X2 n=1 Tax=Magnolia sinica TaxID=86752 RepID=UPI0026581A08|nr:pre-mRNA-splicing factor SLU7-A-like isoform X2 [Magnolia sinica]